MDRPALSPEAKAICEAALAPGMQNWCERNAPELEAIIRAAQTTLAARLALMEREALRQMQGWIEEKARHAAFIHPTVESAWAQYAPHEPVVGEDFDQGFAMARWIAS